MKRIFAPKNGRLSVKPQSLPIPALEYSTDIEGNVACNLGGKLY